MRNAWLWILGILLVAAVGPAAATPVETVFGIDVARAVEDRVTRSAFAGVGVGLGPRAAASFALAGGDDPAVGRTSALVVGLAVAPSATTRLRLRGVRSLDAGNAPAFVRVLAGPEFGAPDATRLGLLYVFEANAAGDRSDGVRAELAVPVAARWVARVNATWATVPRAADALSASLGASFAPARLLELVGELGVARGTALSQQGPLDRLPGDSVPGSAATTTKPTPIALVGFRVTLP
ncbi:MAG: hypothetical protein ABIP29_12045 [Candidatus Eisenbacteria bacterium]